MNIQKITLITTAQPSINPRLVKEADALVEAGYQVKVCYCYRSEWAGNLDQELLKVKRWSFELLGGTPKQHKLRYQWTRIRRRLAEIFPQLPGALPRAMAQAYDELLKAAIASNADLFIAHNPGALPVAAAAARKTGKLYAFDAEDFHTGELAVNHPKSLQIAKLEQQYLPSAVYVTAASQMIAEAYAQKYGIAVQTINNVFNLADQPPFRPHSIDPTLRLFWFSQNLGRDRGLEDVMQALLQVPEIPIEVGILANTSAQDCAYFQSMIHSKQHQLQFLSPRAEKDLINLCAQYDIGLALERREPLNRDLCLTNKLFTYLLAGSAVIASATKAQKAFVNQYPNSGCRTYRPGDTVALAQIIKNWYTNSELLLQDRQNAWNLARTQLNWEEEKKYLLEKLKSIEEGSHYISSLASL